MSVTDPKLGSQKSMPSRHVVAVIVTFNPAIEALKASISSLVDQGCQPLIVDNGSLNADEIQAANLQADLILNDANLGLGAAHNQGWRHAQELEANYLLILDQDSLPKANMVAELVQAHKEQSKANKVSAVGACYENAENGSLSFFVRFGSIKFKRAYVETGTVEVDFLISSGSLFAMESLEQIGGMDEALFIDHVDTEWFLRARSVGFKAFGVADARMRHGLGEVTHSMRIAGRERNIPQHKPFRYYYIFRNSVLLYKRGYVSWLWKWNDIQRLSMILFMFGFLKSPRFANMKMMALGSWHGLLGRSGPVEF